MATTSRKQLDADDPRHGTPYAYRDLGCRCDPCRKSFNAQIREASKRRRAAYVFDPSGDHGTTREYQRGCKCQECRDAQAKFGRDFRKAKPNREGTCESCADQTTLVWDHNHTTGQFRGWLCTPCNQGLGHFDDDPDTLLRAAEYLEAFK